MFSWLLIRSTHEIWIIVAVNGLWLVYFWLLWLIVPRWEGGGGTYTHSDGQVRKRRKWEIFRVRYCISDVAFCRLYIRKELGQKRPRIFFCPLVNMTSVVWWQDDCARRSTCPSGAETAFNQSVSIVCSVLLSHGPGHSVQYADGPSAQSGATSPQAWVIVNVRWLEVCSYVKNSLMKSLWFSVFAFIE
jgi:hypothetical protein